ncbi:MAG: restriction endonuclease subunit S [Desulfuromonadaceae bacterium]|nr:restriction endonuclease subunit S [Desulfuromonadaceae bacterium]MDD5104787.1 restriction endonuclease subunit S [Desulfuromonadaceae bacterium]
MDKWKRARIGDLCQIMKGEIGLASATPGPYPLVATGADRRSCDSWQFDTEAVCIPLVSSTGHGKKSLNYVHYQSGKFAVGTILAAVIPKDPGIIIARFVHLYLSHFKDTVLVPLMKGAANVSLSMKEIASVEIPVPPLDIQQKLINLISMIENEHRELIEETNHQVGLLKQLRQAVIQEAIEGKLTSGWRKQHPVADGDPQSDAVALLQQIKDEPVVSERSQRKPDRSSLCNQYASSLELPKGWVWVKFGELIYCYRGHNPPKTDFKYEPKEGYVRFIQITDFKTDNSAVYVPESKSLKYVKRGEIIMAAYRHIGKLSRDVEGAFNVALCKIMELHPMNRTYIEKLIGTSYIKGELLKASGRAHIPSMHTDHLLSLVVPLPPLAEQQAIVDRVDCLMATIDELEEQVADRKEQAQLLMQTVLREAFDES